MKEKPKGTVIIIPPEKPETAEQIIRRIFNTDIKGFWEKFYNWQEEQATTKENTQ